MKHFSNLEFRKIKSLFYLYEINENGTIFRNIKSKKQLKIFLDMHHSEKGYYASFVNIKGKVKRIMIHTLVAECWLGDKPNGFEIDHIDRNPHNNHYSNLRYVNHSLQMKNRTLGDHVIKQAKKNCLERVRKYLFKPVKISSSMETKEFCSITEASRYLATIYNKSVDHIRSKMKKRRSRIYEYDIEYLTKCRD